MSFRFEAEAERLAARAIQKARERRKKAGELLARGRLLLVHHVIFLIGLLGRLELLQQLEMVQRVQKLEWKVEVVNKKLDKVLEPLTKK